MRLLVIGSSVSIQKKGYLPKLVESLKHKHSLEVELLNASLGGCSTQASLAYTISDLFFGMNEFNADIALIEKSANERYKGFSSLCANEKQKHISDILNNTGELIRWCRTRKITPILISSLFAESSDYSWEVDEESGYLRRCYEELSKSYNIDFIDIHGQLRSLQGHQPLLLDEVHLNDHGATIMAEMLAEKVHQIYSTSKKDAAAGACPKKRDNQVENLQILLKGSKEDWQTNLLKTKYDPIDSGNSGKIFINPNERIYVTGIFFISDPWTSHIKLTPDCDSSRACHVKTFDHMSFFERVDFKRINNLVVENSLEVSIGQRPIDVDKTIESYFASKNFDPEDEWCKNKYLKPLMDRKQNLSNTREKIIAIVGKKEF